MQVDWAPLLGIVAALTIVVGNWAAITQENSKRLLAYLFDFKRRLSACSALVANNAYGNIGLVIYLIVYTFMNMGAFAVIISLRRKRNHWRQRRRHDRPRAKVSGHGGDDGHLYALVSDGSPVTGGFIGKWFLIWRSDANAATPITGGGITGSPAGRSSTSSSPFITTSDLFKRDVPWRSGS